MKWCITALVLLIAASSIHSIANENNATANPGKKTIRIGQSLRDVRDILDAIKLPHGEGGFAFAKTPDQSYLYAKIDPNNTDACIFFSESKQVVTKIDMVFFYSAKGRSKSEPMVPATTITFTGDGSYMVDFVGPNESTQSSTSENGSLPPKLPPSR